MAAALLACLLGVVAVSAGAAPPGVVISHVPATTRTHVGSPSLAILPDGSYVASHDLFGPGSTEWTSATTRVFRSTDRGATWSQVASVEPAFWSGLFVHRGSLYLMGTTHHHGRIVIRRSDDGGATWTTPDSTTTGLLTEHGAYHTAPMPVLVHGGRVWRAFEDAGGGTEWGKRYRAMMLSAPVDADLLDRRSWTFSNALPRDPHWLDGRFNAWLEGNAVAAADGRVLDMLRVDTPGAERAALVEVSADGHRAAFDPGHGFIEFPGGAKKFAVRRDPRSEAAGERPVWWTLASVVAPVDAGRAHPGAVRNTLALMRSEDLRSWEMRSIVLHHPDAARHGFQYVDWAFDGDDLVAVSRTAADDDAGGAPRAHDANFLTFHRLAHVRDLRPVDSVVDLEALGWPSAGGKKAAATSAPRRPNVLVIVADDLGWRDLGCTGSREHRTPRIDALRDGGLLFTEAHAAAPICSASRAALLTGLSPARLHYEFVPKWKPGRQAGDHPLRTPDFPMELPTGTPTVASALAAEGYHTCFVGKWHLNRHHGRYLGWLPGHGPASFGFGVVADDITPEGIVPRAVRMIDEAPADRPFLLWVSHTLVHDPFTRGSGGRVAHHRDRLAAEGVVQGLDDRAHFAAMVEALDDDVGRLLDALDRRGLAESTLVVFTSDNGGHPSVSTRAPLRGSKWNLYQGGVRIPLIVRGPGVAAAGDACAAPVIGTDLVPTLLEACGTAPLPLTDGRSLTPLLVGRDDGTWHDRPLVWHYPFYSPETDFAAALPTIGVDDGRPQQVRPHAAIRVGSRKLLHWFEDGRRELHDLAADPGESDDLADERPAEAAALDERLTATLRDWNARLPEPRGPAAAEAGRREPLNVLFIAADDLRNDLGCYGDAVVHTPHIDRLATRGTVFEAAYCQQAVCNPSRASLLTGRRPDSLRIWDLPTHFRTRHPGIVTLPQHFKRHGYHTEGVGKIFHNWKQTIQGDPESWSVPAVMHFGNHGADRPQGEGTTPPDLTDAPRCEMRDVSDEAYLDGRIAARAVEALREAARRDSPFFLAVGFWKPHAPFNAPKRYWDLYDADTLPPARHPEWPRDAPRIAWHDSREILRETRDGLTPGQARTLRHGYLAAVSYLDAQIGRVLDELERLGLAERTLVVLWSDHGYHLGEQSLWAKTSNFELDARVPLVIAAPTLPAAVRRVQAPVELLDIYPTLLDLAGLPDVEGLEGRSLVPLLLDADAPFRPAALTQHPRPAYIDAAPGGVPDAMGYSVRSRTHRYTEWRDWKTGATTARELYDHAVDPDESVNVAERPGEREVVARHAALLESFEPLVRPGWTPVLP